MNNNLFMTILILVVVIYNIYLSIDIRNLLKDKFQYRLPLHYYDEIGHTPFIKFTIGVKDYIFIIDTGCADCLIDNKVFDEITTINELTLQDKTDYTVIGVHGPVESQTNNVILELKIDEIKFIQEFNSYDLSTALLQINKIIGSNCAGLLGTKFLSKNKAKIDFKHKVMLISKHDLYSK